MISAVNGLYNEDQSNWRLQLAQQLVYRPARDDDGVGVPLKLDID